MKHFFRRGGKNAAEAAQQNVVAVEGTRLNTSAAIKPKRFKHVKLFVFLFLVLVIGAGVAYLLVSGKAYVGLKEPGQKVVITANVCAAKGANDRFTELSKEGFIFKVYSDLAKEIKTYDLYQYDPDCLYIIAYDAATTGNDEVLSNAVDKLDVMNKKGVHLSSDLSRYFTSYNNLKEMKESIFNYEDNKSNKGDSSGRG